MAKVATRLPSSIPAQVQPAQPPAPESTPPGYGVRAIIANSASLVGTTLVTSALGVLYWGLAARVFTPSAVGLGSAAISAMTLIATVATLGLGTLLMGELAVRPRSAPHLLTTALLVSGGAGLLGGAIFAIVAAQVSPSLAPLGSAPWRVALFCTGTSLAAAALVLDQALVGLMLARLQLWRNTIFAVVKLAALGLATFVVSHGAGMAIYGCWASGILVSLAGLWLYAWRKGYGPARGPEAALTGKRRNAVEHHAFNLALQVPVLALPIIVSVALSTAANARFYVALMIASFIWMVPIALSTVLFPSASAAPETAAEKLRLTTRISVIVGVLANGFVWLTATPLLSIFGTSYTAAAWPLRLLALQVFPVIVKTHYVAVARISRRIGQAIPLVWIGSLGEIVAAVIGINVGGLTGLTLAWMGVLCIEAMVMAPTVHNATRQLPAA
jgi:O-antigen/teichoic acid export membrane protein